MKKETLMAAVAITASVTMGSCSHSKTGEMTQASTEERHTVPMKECDITFDNIHFTQALNGADSLTNVISADSIIMHSEANKDFIINPNGKDVVLSSPILLTEIDNTKPFTFTSHVAPAFTHDGIYSAGGLYVYVNPERWIKIAFEQDERGGHRVVTVRTEGTSDDNNHDLITAETVMYKISSDTNVIGFYYSTDGQQWQLVRIFQNTYPEKIFLGISVQCPCEDSTMTLFSHPSLTNEAVKNFRLGE